MGMRKSVVLLASMAAAMVLASIVTLATTVDPARAAFPGTNGKIAFLSDRDGQNEIYTISFSGGKWGSEKRLTNNSRSDKTPAFSPDGKKIVWEGGSYLYLMNADGSNQHQIPNTFHSNYEIGRYGSYGGNPAFSRDGGKIMFDKDRDIWTIKPDGTGLTRIANAPAGGTCQENPAYEPTFVHPVWSPVSKKIAFSWLSCGVRELHVMSLSDLQNGLLPSTASRLSPAGVGVYRPDWSPDGTQIVYEYCADLCDPKVSPQTYNPDIYKVDLNGDNTPVVTGTADDSYPVFSPGGGKIVFSSNRTTGPGVNNPTGDEELFIINADGSGDPKQITFNQARDVEPDWQPI
jgi:Tol biopolymer transport system component